MKKLVHFPLLLIMLFCMVNSTFAYYLKNSDGKYIYFNVKSSEAIIISPTESSIRPSSGFSPVYSGVINIPNSVSYKDKMGKSHSVTVVGIQNKAFANSTGLTAVTIPRTVKSIGDNTFENCTNLTSINIPNSVTEIGTSLLSGCTSLSSITVENGNSNYDSRDNCNAIIETASNKLLFGCSNSIVPNDVVSIESNAFSGSGITTISIPSNVKTIGSSAFYGCKKMSSIIISNGITSIGEMTFADCVALSTISLPNSVTIIGNMSFYGCSALSYINLPNSVTTIGNMSFYGCSALSSISLPNSISSIGYGAFSGTGITSFIFPTGVTTLRWGTFEDCKYLSSIVIPANMTTIENAFSGCTSLENISVEDGNPKYDSRNNCNGIIETETNILKCGFKTTQIPNTVTSIGESAFYGCTGLTSINIPEGITSIANYTFQGCSGLISVHIPNSVNFIGSQAFLDCAELTSITIPDNVASFGENVFSGCIKLASINIPNGITKIPYGAFYNCRSLSSIIIPCSVTEIVSDAFRQSGLTSVVIPSKITSIGDQAFEDCDQLISVSLPNSLTNIEERAFYNCNNLVSVRVNKVEPLIINENVFTNRTNATLYVPAESMTAYEAAACWKQFKRIVEYVEGDVNVDKQVNVVDVVDIARFVVGIPANTFVEILADINTDGNVNLGDAVALVNDIAGDQNFVKAWAAPSTFTTNDAINLTERGGCLSMNLENERSYSAFQFDLYVPENVDVTQIMLNAERKQGHQLLYNKVEDGHYRVATLSTSNNEFNGTNGELLNITLNGEDKAEVIIRNIHFFDVEGQEYVFEDVYGSSPTSIRQIDNGQWTIDNPVYDLQGRKREKMQKGVNIVNGRKILF